MIMRRGRACGPSSPARPLLRPFPPFSFPPLRQNRGEKSLIASGGFDGRILLHEVTGSIRAQLMSDPAGGPGPGGMPSGGGGLDQRAIEQLLVLSRRGGTLVAAPGDGYLYFWRIITGSLAHEVPAGHGRHVVTAMCSDADNAWLYTADASGRILGWSLEGLHFQKGLDFLGKGWDTIRQVHAWRAHHQLIHSLDVVPCRGSGGVGSEREKAAAAAFFVLTASADGLSKLFTHEGSHVGTFGADAWNLHQPSSFHPRPLERCLGGEGAGGGEESPSQASQSNSVASSPRPAAATPVGRTGGAQEVGTGGPDFANQDQEHSWPSCPLRRAGRVLAT